MLWQPLVSAADRAERWLPGRWLDADYADVPAAFVLVRSEKANHAEQKNAGKHLLGDSTRELKGVHQTVRAALCLSGRCRSGAGALCQQAETTGDCATATC